MARIIVSGATGFLGGALARYLHAGGHNVIALGRSPAALGALRSVRIRTVALDLTQDIPSAVTDLIGAADAMVHCAALSSPWGAKAAFTAANVHGTATALQLATDAGVRRFVNISSPTVYYANRDQIGVAEDQVLPRPINAYAETKREAEKLVLNNPQLGPINLRPRGLYGAGEITLLPRLLAAARQGPLPLLRGGVAEIDLTHVSDAVRAIEAAVHASAQCDGQTFNISGGQPRRVVDIVNDVCRLSAVPVRWRSVPWRAAMAVAGLSEGFHARFKRATEPRLTCYKVGLFAFRQSLDISKAERCLGWRPLIDFDAGLDLTLSERAGP